MDYYDVYALCADRSPVSFEKFQSSYLIGAEKSADEYEFPRFAETKEFITEDLSVILEKLFFEKEEEYAIYWHISLYGPISSAMMFFTNDGYVIYGLTVAENQAIEKLEDLKKEFSCEFGGITFEQPPPLNSEEFIEVFAESLRCSIDVL